MTVHAFVFNWKGNEANAVDLEQRLGRPTRVTVINSEEGIEVAHPQWVHLDDSAYFSAQWSRALELFDGDLFFHIQADARFDEFERLFARMQRVFEQYDVGVYEPNVDYTAIQYETSRLTALEQDLRTTSCPLRQRGTGSQPPGCHR